MSAHRYPGCLADDAGATFYTSDCSYGCGAWMGSTRSGAPDGIDPFGECPKAPATAGKVRIIVTVEDHVAQTVRNVIDFELRRQVNGAFDITSEKENQPTTRPGPPFDDWPQQ